jgi:hypothetical protein
MRVFENRALRITFGLRVGEIKGWCRKVRKRSTDDFASMGRQYISMI